MKSGKIRRLEVITSMKETHIKLLLLVFALFMFVTAFALLCQAGFLTKVLCLAAYPLPQICKGIQEARRS